MLYYGFHAVVEIVERTGFLPQDELYLARSTDGRTLKILTKARRAGVAIFEQSYRELTALCGSKNHQGIVLKRQQELVLQYFPRTQILQAESGIYLALEGIQDPHNLGAICRTALGLGVAGIFLPQKNTAPVGAAALKSSAGALLQIPLCFTSSIAALMHWLAAKRPELVMLVLDKNGEPFTEQDRNLLAQPVLVIVGSERGVSRLVHERATHRRRLLMDPRLESYNVSVATALALYELRRLEQSIKYRAG